MKDFNVFIVFITLTVLNNKILADDEQMLPVQLECNSKPLKIVIEQKFPNCCTDNDHNVIGKKSMLSPEKAEKCAKAPCNDDDGEVAICACNHINGKVASFKNRCDLKRHNCRYDTEFAEMLIGVCPWEYQSRRSNNQRFDYNQIKYFN